MARATRFTTATREKILALLRDGCSNAMAAESCGINQRTLKTWLARGRENLAEVDAWEAEECPEGPRPRINVWGRFAVEVDVARTVKERRANVAIQEAIVRGDAKIAMAWLARRRPLEYGETIAVGVQGVDEDGERVDHLSNIMAKLDEVEARTANHGDK